MDGQPIQDAALISAEALGRLMPMYLWITPMGLIRAAGPTLMKVCDPAPLVGERFLHRFDVERPRTLMSMADVHALEGQRIVLYLRDGPETRLRGQAQPLGSGQGWLMNLSFGIAVAEAVRDHRLTNADFAPTDQTVELLYLTEVKAAVTGELRGLNARLRRAHEEAMARALSDPLTGLANRRAFQLELARECQLAARGGAGFALLHLDLDFFKAVNDTLGHAAGDHVLSEVANILREETRRSDTAARIGGDEFTLILRGENDAERAARVGARIISELERPILFEERPCLISGSIGLVVSSFYLMPDPERMQTEADEATYAAKRAGRGRCAIGGPN